jgi:hypothetical protein
MAPSINKPKTPSKEIVELCAVIDNMASSLATVKAN